MLERLTSRVRLRKGVLGSVVPAIAQEHPRRTFQGETYRESDGWRVVVRVNDQPVTPSEHVLSDGDSIRILVERA
jgi:molybdopterin converting factor small subunit